MKKVITKDKMDIGNAEHPLRQAAIDILEHLTSYIKPEPKGNKWFELEDLITEVLAKHFKKLSKGRR